MLNHLDLFSGYGGFTIPAKQFNIETIAFSEIDKYANAVLRYRFPNIPNLGDVGKIDTSKLSHVDLITGGTPCQDLSVAGKGAGLKGKRSGLFFHFIRIVRNVQPSYFIWENVKGALSSNNGWDFTRVQIEMEQAGYSIEWRVLNAKDFGVPQNRERVFVLGTRGEGRREVLPQPEGTGQALKELTQKVSDAQRIYDTKGSAKSLKALGGGLGAKTGLYVEPNSNGNVHALDSNYWKGTNTLDKSRRSQVIEPRAVLTPGRPEKRQNGRRFKNPGEPSFTLTGQDKHGVMVKEVTKKGYDMATEGDSINFSVLNSKTLRGRVGKGVANTLDTASNQATIDGYRIRRLTPIECERLMGLPDNWTKIGILNNKKTPISDTQRYKLCGNGVVTTVVKAIYSSLIKTSDLMDLTQPQNHPRSVLYDPLSINHYQREPYQLSPATHDYA